MDDVANPHLRWGAAVVARVDPAGVGRVLDAGCGTGIVTELLLGRLPHAKVIALDNSRPVLERAATRLGAAVDADRVELVLADLTRPIPIDPVDAVLSTATLHWIGDHDTVFANLAAVLRPGGQLVAQCGGGGTIRTGGGVRVLGESWAGDTYFATPEDTAACLDKHGFVDVATWLDNDADESDYVRLNIVARRAG